MLRYLAALAFAALLSLPGFQESRWDIYRARQVTPPESWRVQYERVNYFTEEDGDFDDVAWFMADSMFRRDGHLELAGLWLEEDIIVISRQTPDTLWTVCHEAVHQIRQLPNHNDILFTACYDGGLDYPTNPTSP